MRVPNAPTVSSDHLHAEYDSTASLLHELIGITGDRTDTFLTRFDGAA